MSASAQERATPEWIEAQRQAALTCVGTALAALREMRLADVGTELLAVAMYLEAMAAGAPQ